MKAYLISLLLLLVGATVFSQKNIGGGPRSNKYGLTDENVPTADLPSLDMAQIYAEDALNDAANQPFRFAYPIPVSFSLENAGHWELLPDGGRIWRLKIHSPGALGLTLLYEDFYLPPGALLYIYSEDQNQVIGGFNQLNNQATEKFAHAILYDETATIEYYEPAEVQGEGRLTVFQVGHGYRMAEDCVANCELGQSGDCQVNINCSEGNNWQDEKKGVARIVVFGTWWCSGSLINTTAEDCTPYFLTAHHCLPNDMDALGNNDASTWCFYWNYEYPGCPNAGDVPEEITVGATLMANDLDSDFALFLLTENPANSFDVYFNGFNATNEVGIGGVGIHHPRGDAKKIATHDIAPADDSWFGTFAGTHWRISPWASTANGFSVTESGSSGSPLFDPNHRIIGQLHGGSSINCEDPAADPGRYGKLSWSWDNNGATDPARRLRDWLDPVGGGDNTQIDGRYPEQLACTASNSGPYCQGQVVEITVDAPSADTWSWVSLNGTADILTPNASTSLVLGTVDGEIFEVTITDPNGCQSTCTTVVSILPAPTANPSTNAPICEGETLELSANPSGGTPDYSFDWEGPNAFHSTEENPEIEGVTLAAEGQYRVIVIDANDCRDTAYLEVVIFPNPEVNPESSSPVCEDDPLYLFANASGGTQPYEFLWSPAGNLNDATLEVPVIWDAEFADAGVYSVVVTDQNGCTDEGSTAVIVRENIIDPGFIGEDQYFCGSGYDPDPIISLAQAMGTGPIEYFWMRKAASSAYWEVIPGATAESYDPPTLYETTLYGRCARRVGCLTALESNMVEMVIGEEAMAIISGPKSTCIYELATYSVPEQAGATYSWDFGPGATPVTTNTHSVEVSWSTMGVRTVQVKVTTPECIATNYQKVFVSNSSVYCGEFLLPASNSGSSSLEYQSSPASSQFDFSVAPNPFTDQLEISLNQLLQVEAQLEVVDLQGKIVHQGVLVPGQARYQLNLQALSSGFYLVVVKTANAPNRYQKIVKR